MTKAKLGTNYTFFGEFMRDASPIEIDSEEGRAMQRRDACAKSLSKFALTYFPDVFTSDFCEFHLEVMESIEYMILKMKSRKNHYCRCAPRGHGKSQIISFLVIIWCICYNYKQNILLVSDTNEQAKQFIMAIKQEIEDNELICQDFGDLTGRSTWSQDKIVTRNDIHVLGRGAGQKLRGTKHRNNRPDLIIIDDLENDENVETDSQRKKLRTWFLKALLPAGQATTDYIYIGTILHYESLLQEVLMSPKFSNWNRKKYQAVYEFSQSKLWDDWEKIMGDLTLDDPAEEGYKFYALNRAEMLDGVNALWLDSGKDYYYNLMVTKYQDEEAFDSEYQNDPISEKSRAFQEEWFQYYDELPEIIDVYAGVDPSMSKTARSDRAAIVWIGKDANNYLYVLDVVAGRYKPDELIELIIEGFLRYQTKLRYLVVEVIQFQAMFRDELEKRSMNIGLSLPIEEFKDRTDKLLRIRGLVPKVKNGHIKFHVNQIPLLNEMRRFPKTTDDILDALQMAVSMAYPALSGLVFGKVDNTGGGGGRYYPQMNIKSRW